MRKTFITFALGAAAIVGCGSDGDNTETYSEERATANMAWSILTPDERDDLCNDYETYSKELIIEYFVSPPDPQPRGVAETFYALIEERC